MSRSPSSLEVSKHLFCGLGDPFLTGAHVCIRRLLRCILGIRAPRTARNQNEKSEPFGAEAQEFVSRRCLQRDAEAEVEATDKSGGFIGERKTSRFAVTHACSYHCLVSSFPSGSLYINKESVALMLVREGLARVDEYNATSDLKNAEELAKKERKNVGDTP